MSTIPPRPRPRGPDRAPEPPHSPASPDSAHPAKVNAPPPRPPRPRPNLEAGIALLLGALFLGSGVSKLVAPDFLVRSFEQWGYGTGFMTLVGLAEIVGAVLLVIPATRGTGAAMLAVIMVGAVVTHGTAGQWWSLLLPLGVLALIALMMRPRWLDPAFPRHSETGDAQGDARELHHDLSSRAR